MLIFAVLFLLGSTIALQLYAYWSFATALLSVFVMVACLKAKPKGFAFFVCALAGLLWSGCFAWHAKQAIINTHCDTAMQEGVVISLPIVHAGGLSLRVLDPETGSINSLLWHDPSFSIQPGQWLHLQVTRNPVQLIRAPFFSQDSELFSHHIACDGKILHAEQGSVAPGYGLAKLRYYIQQRMRALLVNESHAGMIEALIIGTREKITSHEKKLFQETGTSHLIAISGLHIGMISAAVFYLMSVLARLLPISRGICIAFTCLSALLYAALAGFSHPTLRAVVMIFAFLFSTMQRRASSAADRLGLALFSVLIIEPFSPLFLGFWLSFAAVAGLVMLSMRKIAYFETVKLQILMSLILIPVTLLFFQKFSLASPIANLIAIPIFSMITVPAAFLGTLFLSVSDVLTLYLYQLSALSMSGLLVIFDFLTQYSWNIWHMPQDAMTDLILAFAATLSFFMFPNRVLRLQACVLMLPLIIRMLLV